MKFDYEQLVGLFIMSFIAIVYLLGITLSGWFK